MPPERMGKGSDKDFISDLRPIPPFNSCFLMAMGRKGHSDMVGHLIRCKKNSYIYDTFSCRARPAKLPFGFSGFVNFVSASASTWLRRSHNLGIAI